MTVIAYRDGVMASDSMAFTGDLKTHEVKKIFRLSDGSLFGGAGWAPIIKKAMTWIESGALAAERPDPTGLDKNDIDALVVRPNGEVWRLSEQFELWPSNQNFGCCGAHYEFVYGAMWAGASAEEAVALAIKYCVYAAGAVQVMRL